MSDLPAVIETTAVEHRPMQANEFQLIQQQAEILAQSDIIPSAYRRKPANIVAAGITGRAFGWDVLTAMRNGHVIEGTWSIKPEAMLALVRRAGHSVTGTAAPEGATVTGKRSDSGDEMTVAFTMKDAQRAGLNNKNTWKQYPQSMCWARAVSSLCRMLFPDVTLGLAYTPEELGADVNADGEPVAAQPAPEALPAGEPPCISDENLARFLAKCDERHLSDDDIALAVVEATDGRTADPAFVWITEVPALRAAMDRLVADKATPAEPSSSGSVDGSEVEVDA